PTAPNARLGRGGGGRSRGAEHVRSDHRRAVSAAADRALRWRAGAACHGHPAAHHRPPPGHSGLKPHRLIMSNDHGTAEEAVAAWVAAEAGGDAATIGGLLSEEFTGVGPLGFVLSRADWLDRHASGAL